MELPRLQRPLSEEEWSRTRGKRIRLTVNQIGEVDAALPNGRHAAGRTPAQALALLEAAETNESRGA